MRRLLSGLSRGARASAAAVTEPTGRADQEGAGGGGEAVGEAGSALVLSVGAQQMFEELRDHKVAWNTKGHGPGAKRNGCGRRRPWSSEDERLAYQPG